MATQYICDRCDCINTSIYDITKLDITWKNDVFSGERIIRADLCASCMRKLEEFVKLLPIEARK